MFKCHFKSLSIPKLGNSILENEDNLLVPGNSQIETDKYLNFAVSDGATEYSFSKEWSSILVNSYSETAFDSENFIFTLEKNSKVWTENTYADNLPWYVQQKAALGAFATFLGLTINLEESFFDVVAIGDSTLFQIRNDKIHSSFPIVLSEEFNNTPNLIASNPLYQKDIKKKLIYAKYDIQADDIIVVATDALAAWFLKQNENVKKPWEELLELLNVNGFYENFEKWLNNQRNNNDIKNDDVTLLLIKLEE